MTAQDQAGASHLPRPGSDVRSGHRAYEAIRNLALGLMSARIPGRRGDFFLDGRFATLSNVSTAPSGAASPTRRKADLIEYLKSL
jgi:hypothetical protein